MRGGCRWRGGDALRAECAGDDHAVKAKLHELQKTLPQGVEIVPVYDRSALIEESVKTR